MRKTLLLVLVFICSALSYAQDWQWIRDGGSNDDVDPLDIMFQDEQVIDLVSDADRNIYGIAYVGASYLQIDGEEKENYDNACGIAVFSFTCSGEYRWSKIMGGRGRNLASSIALDSENNVYVTGIFGGYQYSPEPPRIEDDYTIPQGESNLDRNRLTFLTKFDENGAFQWIKRPQPQVVPDIDTPTARSYQMYIEDDIIHWFLYLDNGSYADGNYTVEETGDHLAVLKYDTSGDFIEGIPLSYNSADVYGVRMYRNPYNDYYYMRYRQSGTSTTVDVGGSETTNSAFIACWDDNGVFQWIVENDSPNIFATQITGLDFDPENNLYIAGSIVGFGNSNSFLGLSVEEDENPVFLMKTNPTADEVFWTTTHTNTAGGISTVGFKYYNNELIYAAEGGGTNFVWGDESININEPGKEFDVLLATFDSQTGDVNSLETIEGDDYYRDTANTLIVDANGDYIIGGGFGHYIYDVNEEGNYNEDGLYNFFIAKYAKTACGAITVGTEELAELGIQLYPNPIEDKLLVKSENKIEHIQIKNLLGQEVAVFKNVGAFLFEVNTSRLTSGSYFIDVKTESTLLTEKLIKL